MKAKLADSTFLYLLKDYLKETDTWVTLTEQIKNRAKLETINYNPLYQPYIDLQYQTLIEHQLELKSHFGDWKSKIELERILNRVGLTTKKNVVNKKVSSKKQNITELKQNKVKVYLLNEECDNYLLKNVFNVKID